MNVASIRQLADTFSKEQLQTAESSLLEEQPLAIDVPGVDEGEQLTHVIAAQWVITHKAETGVDTMTAIRAYTKRVRQSIS
jgi:hypothetical protein